MKIKSLFKVFTEWRDLKWKNTVLQEEMDTLMDEMARVRLENRAYDAELGTTANKILKLRCELNNVRQIIRLDGKIKIEQRKQWARDKTPGLLEAELAKVEKERDELKAKFIKAGGALDATYIKELEAEQHKQWARDNAPQLLEGEDDAGK
jgi:predicted RNase H-like nuclease (RuvC/YqgF family)